MLAIIVNETPGSPLPLDDAVASIARFAEPVLGVPAPRRQGGEPAAGPCSAVCSAAKADHCRDRRSADKNTALRRSKLSREKMQLHHGLERALEIKQRVQQERQQQRAAAPAHPAEIKADDENLRDAGPVVLHMQRRP